MNEKDLKQAFNHIGKNKVSDTVDIWPNLKRKISINSHDSFQEFIYTPNRIRWSVLTVVIVFLLASTAYALSPHLRNLLNQDPALNSIALNELGHVINQTQSHQGVEVTLEWAYADENRASIIYTISGNNEAQYLPVESNLLSVDGTNIPSFVGMTESKHSVPTNGYLFSYDLSSYPEQTDLLELQLTLILKSTETNQLLEPFEFQFDLPVAVAHVAKPNHQITTKDISITLQEVTNTPTEVTAILCFDDPDLEYQSWLPISQIEVQSANGILSAMVGQQNKLANGCISNRYFPSLYEAQGIWTLTVTELVGFREGKPLDENAPVIIECTDTQRSEYCEEQLRIEGSWVFEFEFDK